MRNINEPDDSGNASVHTGPAREPYSEVVSANEDARADAVDAGPAPDFVAEELDADDVTQGEPPPVIAAVDPSGDGVDAGAAPEGLED